jgi:mono/diheme cytochrome c family protein
MTTARRVAVAMLFGLGLPALAAETVDTAAQRGEKALLGRAFTPPAWSPRAYQTVWRRWGGDLKQAPADYAAAFAEHYGLHAAPFPNNGYPMGLREAQGLFSKGLTTDCLLCHGSSIAGRSYVGLGNASLDIQSFFEDLSAADGMPGQTPHVFGNVRGTSEAGAMATFLFSLREPDLRLRKQRLHLGLQDDLCEDVPAWWLLKKKTTMYYTGGGSARSVRSLMQFMLTPVNARTAFEREEPTFRDIQAFILGLEPPKYPFPIDTALARQGEQVFGKTCARCHGTYGPNGTYPNKIVSLDVIGTDRRRYEGLSRELGEHYNRSWFAHENAGWFGDDYPARATAGYQAPPLDGVWATAPYLHNGSVPTVYDLLSSKSRPKVFTRSYRTGSEEYDPVKLGWRVQVLEHGADPKVSGYERRKVYDTALPGRGNGGHTFGDDLSEAERLALIEYLKTL